MSWLFSQALVAEYSAAICSAGEPSAQLSVMPTQHRFWRNDKPMDFSRLSRFGLTCAVLTAGRGEELLTLFLVDSRARTSVLPEAERVSKDHAAGCGHSLRGSLATYNRATHSLRTAQDSLFSDLTEYSATLPRSGSMRNGECYQRPTLGRLTSASDCGLLPTPTASAMPCEGTVRLMRKQWQAGNYTLEEASAIAGRDVRKSQGKVPAMEVFQTPTVCGNYNRKRASKTSGDGLATYVHKFPTPTATAYKGWSKNHNRAMTDDRLDYTVEREANECGQPGRLNPTWEEWLMAWPIGWTELKPLEMGRFQLWLRQHSPCFASAQGGVNDH